MFNRDLRGVLWLGLVCTLACSSDPADGSGGGGGSSPSGGGSSPSGSAAGSHAHAGGADAMQAGGGAAADGNGASAGASRGGGAAEGSGGNGNGAAFPSGGSGGDLAGSGAEGNQAGSVGQTPPDPPAINGCLGFVDRTAEAEGRQLAWTEDLIYDPARCMQIRVGQSVTFVGDFENHPLIPYLGDEPNPIGPSATFESPGLFGYLCVTHPEEMNGAILVVP